MSQGGLSQVLRASQELAEPPTPEDTNIEPIHSRPMAGRTVPVTGGTSGIGRAAALGLATMGAHLAITGRDRGSTEGAARELQQVADLGAGRLDGPGYRHAD